jgi:large subunit ribosomal protein L29
MKFDDLKKKTPDDLRKELDSITFDLMRYNAQVATGGAGKDSGKIRELKRTIARIKTLQRQVELKSAKPVKAKTTKSKSAATAKKS